MTLNIEVTGELEVALKAHATQQGVSADRLARRLLVDALAPAAGPEENYFISAAIPSGEEKAKAFVQWAKSHRDTPPLSDVDISRDSLYPDRW